MGTFTATIKAQLLMAIALCKVISPSSREISLAITDMQRAFNWLTRYENALGETNSYPKITGNEESLDQSTREIVIGQIMAIQQEILDTVFDTVENGKTPSEKQIFLAMNALEESMGWLGNALLLPNPAPIAKPVPVNDLQVVTPPLGVKAPEPIVDGPPPAVEPGRPMSFYKALEHCLYDGARISRLQWNPGLCWVAMSVTNSELLTGKFLYRKLPTGQIIPWQPDQLDLFATDWIVLK